MPYRLICTKTGRFWPVVDHKRGDRLALRLGLKDYEIEPT